jgi:hypothetical protein
MKSIHARAATLAIVLALAGATRGSADADLRAAGRAILEKKGAAIVTVKLVLKRRMVVNGQERGSSETTSEISGTVIDASGLTVVSDSASNPWGMYSSDSDTTKIDTDTSDVKLLLGDGREISAHFVLRDRDLDLAFVEPEGADLKLPFIALEGGKVPQLLDDVFFLYRAGKNLNREVSIAQSRVQTIVHKPRTFVVSDWLNATAALGGPVFDASGALVGVVVLRRTPGPPDRAQNPMRMMFDVLTPVILTVTDLKTVTTDATRAAAKNAKP